MNGKYQMDDQYSNLNELNTRLRILEGKYNLTRERMLIINQNMLDHYKKTNVDLKSIEEDLSEIKESLEVLKNAIKTIMKEIKFLARKEEVKVLEKYINMWNPLKLVTREEVEELIEKRLKNAKK